MEYTPATHLAYLVAYNEAAFLKSKYLEPEHFLIGLFKVNEYIIKGLPLPEQIDQKDKQAMIREVSGLAELYKKHSLDSKQLRRRLRFLIGQEQKESGDFSGHRSESGRALFDAAESISKDRGETQLSLMALLSACLASDSPQIGMLCKEYNIQADVVADEAASWEAEIDQVDQDASAEDIASPDEEEEENESEGSYPHELAKYGRDLTLLARQGKLGPIIGRREEIKDIARILTQRSRNNPLLLGDPGVGKTAIVEGLALYMIREDAAESIRKLQIVEITLSSLVAGTKYRGDFEDRIQKVIEIAKQDENLVLFIDELHTLIGAGAVEGTLDASNILKPALGRGEISVIGATTTAEFRKCIEPDGALTRRFQLVWVDEPSHSETLEILTGLRPKLEKHHAITIGDDVLERAVTLTSRFITDGYQPDKAIMVLDEACARRKLLTLGPIRPGMQTTTLELEDIGQVVSRRTQVPLEVILTRDEERLVHIEEELSKSVIGQEEAVSAVGRAIRIARAGLKPSNRPVVLLFAGPTGTGKTELAKVLSRFLFFDSKRLIRLDMSEFMESHAVSKIIGSPPGYIGFGEEPQFIREIRLHPYSVVLLDEIEKAHPSIMLTFLQVFDEGRLTDARGRTINCSEATFIMTSNLGTGVKVKPAVGFLLGEDEVVSEQQAAVTQYHQAIVEHMSPELVNRIQEIVVFKPLSQEAISRILDLYLADTSKRLKERSIQVSMDDGSKALLSQAGFSQTYGARYLKRVFDRWITEPLSEHILAGKLKPGDTAHFTSLNKQMVLEIKNQDGGVVTIPFSINIEEPPKT